MQAIWNQDESRILITSADHTARIWDAATGGELVRLTGHTDYVNEAVWSQDASRILTRSSDGTARIWDATTGNQLVYFDVRMDIVLQATWTQDESRILISSADDMFGNAVGTVNIWYTKMNGLLVAACQWTPRNFTWSEWSTYMQENVDDYRPTCPNAPSPPDAIEGIQDEARQLMRDGQRDRATQRLAELNSWLQVNGQFKIYGVEVDAFIAEVAATTAARP